MSEALADPRTRPVSTAEYLTWRRAPEAARKLRHEDPPPRQPTEEDLHALEHAQVTDHYSAAYLRAAGVAAGLFGRAGRVAFKRKFVVPYQWTVRAAAVFTPADDTGCTVALFRPDTPPAGDPSAPPFGDQDLFTLAYHRFTIRASGVEVVRCGFLSPRRPVEIRGTEPDRDDLFVFHDVTDRLDRPDPSSGVSIGELVAEEAPMATGFLQSVPAQ